MVFRPRTRIDTRRQRRTWILCALALLFVAGIWNAFADHEQAIPAYQQENVEKAPFTIEFTGMQWHNQPVYQLTNHGHETMERVTVQSWSESLLPVLSIGAHASGNLSNLPPDNNPPYSLPSNQSMWFVGSSTPPSEFYVVWHVGQDFYSARSKVVSTARK